jgi:polysaccharide biosynthesis/export protein
MLNKSGQAVIAALFLLLGLNVARGAAEEGGGNDKDAAKLAPSVSAQAGNAPRNITSSAQRNQFDRDFIIGPDDVLAINVWREPEVSQTVTVRPDGKISLPLAGEVGASGLTPLELQAVIARQLQRYLSRPEVTVIVHEVKSRRFVVAGEVAKPGSYELQMPMTVLDAIAEAGGPLDYAKAKSIYVLRVYPDGRAMRFPFNYRQVMKGRNLSQNIVLQSHDTIVVP